MKTRQTTSRGASPLRLSTLVVAIALTGASSSEPSRQPPVLPSDPWPATRLMTTEDLSTSLSKAAGEKPLVLYVGPRFTYLGGHIAGSIFAGPASKTDGLEALKAEVKNLSRDKSIVLYCGCCPWKDCPNIRPAFRAMEDLGFKNVRVLYLPTNLRRDWIDKGLPTQKGDDAK
jgi:thiosulfate/3-mercaptopyruvate sulfurtransferase